MRRRRGATLVESLVASLLATVVLMGLVRLWGFGYKMTMSTNDKAIAYNLARQTTERVRGTGFNITLDGTDIRYYDAAGLGESYTQTSAHRFRVTLVVTTDRLMTNSQTGATQPAPTALRTAKITVTLIPTNEVLQQTTTHLARAGV
jgi:Tfp pilus assembly protein PilV